MLRAMVSSLSARKQGVATALIRALDELKNERGFGHLYWTTHVQNTAANSVYSKLAALDNETLICTIRL